MDKSSQNRVPQLSVIMPVYNVERFLEEALDSVINQSFRDYEIIAVNDGSTDQSGEILENYALTESRLRIIQTNNRGLSAARNEGMRHATGNWIYYFDSDDMLAEGSFSELMALVKECKCDMAAFSGVCIDENSMHIPCQQPYLKPDQRTPTAGRELFKQMMQNDKYSPVVSMYLYRKEFLNKNHLAFSEGFIHEDEAFTIKAFFLAEHVVSTRSTFHKHRIRAGSIMSEKYGLNNVKGWAKAVSDITNFMEKEELGEEDRKPVIKRLMRLVKNCAGIISELNKESGANQSYKNWFSEKELNMLGNEVKFMLKWPLSYRIYTRLISLFSTR